MARSYIGIDLHRTVIQICVLDEHGEIVAEKRIRYQGMGGAAAVISVVISNHATQRMAAKLRPREMLPRFVSSTAGRASEARGRQLQRLGRQLRYQVQSATAVASIGPSNAIKSTQGSLLTQRPRWTAFAGP